MKTEILKGTSEKLYHLIAPLVLNAAIIRQNDGNPFKTSEKHVYVVAISGNKCVGFLPLCHKTDYFETNNYYALQRDPKIMEAMIKSALKYVGKGATLKIIAQKYDYKIIESLGFSKTAAFVKCAIFINQP